jgi:pre-mRNA-splicing factor CDC5/CEF1
MKYGLNQWARISSLLVRKSAKQCKARWYEWLDPSIKKTEWSREEEEKLLHLAKLMPTQWRTIAPIVGRTAAQCLEHYEKLLDAAQGKDESYDPSEDPRRLRPGEIDPHPETKPARPDPVDMDEDEKEMLSEARARLANTKGKKAKRKAREKQLEEARRLASLQKRRELKAAGISMPVHRRKMRGMDYNKEIPFLKQVPAGFYDTTDETDKEKARQRDPSFISIALQRLEARRRDEEEEQARKRDANKQALRKMKDMPAAIMQINKLNDPKQIRQRSSLKLPAPQVSDAELEEIAKLGNFSAAEVEGEGESEATRMLLGDYSATPARTPARGVAGRTPMRDMRTPARQDTLRTEAQNLLALTSGETPLKGGENTPLHPSDFSGATPRRFEVQTPNALATPLRTPRGGPEAGMTPRIGKGKGRAAVAATPRLVTPLRDELKINEGMEEGDDYGRPQDMELQQKLLKGLSSLPAPTNEYKLLMPELPEDDEGEGSESAHEEDAEDVLAKERAVERLREEARLRMRSQVVQRGLPRPLAVNKAYAELRQPQEDADQEAKMLAAAEALVMKELLALVTHDAARYPIKGAKGSSAAIAHLEEEFDEEEIAHARALLQSEVDQLKEERGDIPPEMLERLLAEAEREVAFLPSSKRFSLEPSSEENLTSLRTELEAAHTVARRDAGRASKLEKKLNVYNGGYQRRAATLAKEIEGLVLRADQSSLEVDCFRELQKLERDAAPKRIEALKAEVQELTDRELRQQMRYANLQAELEARRPSTST